MFANGGRFRAVTLIVALVFSLVSCKGLSPFLRSDGMTELLRYAGREGDTIIYVNARTAGGVLAKVMGVDPETFSRFRDAIVIADGNGLSGVLEGNVPLVAKNYIIESLGGKGRQLACGKCYVSSAGDREFYFGMPYRGVMLFSFSPAGYEKVHSYFVGERKPFMDDAMWQKLQKHDIGIYGVRPENSVSPIFQKGYVRNTLLLCDVTGDGKLLFNGDIFMNDSDSLRSLSTVMRNEYAEDLRRRGDKMDLKMLQSSFRISYEECCLRYENFIMTESLLLSLISGV